MAGYRFGRPAVGLLEGIGRRLWGFPPRLMPFIVDQLGPVRAVGWFVGNMPRYELTRRAFGPLRTHLLSTAVSLVNSCEYCSFGHAYALDLIYLRDHGRLFPLSVEEILQLRDRPPGTIRDELADALEAAGLPAEVAWLDRVLALKSGRTRPTTPDDARIAHLIAMFGVLNEGGIACRVAPDQAHDPVNKDARLRNDHERLRSQAG